MERATACTEKGYDVRCQVASRGIGVMLGLQATFHPFMGFPSYKEISHLPLAERVQAMRNPELKVVYLEKHPDGFFMRTCRRLPFDRQNLFLEVEL